MRAEDPQYEPIFMVWELYDGPRTGIAQFRGAQYYFSCQPDRDDGGYAETFELFPVDAKFLEIAQENWEIYREWEIQFHTGQKELTTHPGHSGINRRYDETNVLLESAIKSLSPIPTKFNMQFRALPGQDHLPIGVLKNLEATWNTVS